jgi:PPOX class probable F420-dependent enzyme
MSGLPDGARPYRRARPVGEALADPLVAELLAARLIATLATQNTDGSVHLVAMWFLRHDDALLFPTSRGTLKARNLGRDPRATVMIDDSRGGLDLRGVTLTGHAELLAGADAQALNRLVHLKYLTEAGRDLEPVDRYLSGDDVTIRFVPERVSSWDLRSSGGAEALAASGECHPLA